ncbi:MAG TPA: DmsC/YnfH family molybdoenzyme membrane anchor subunit [Kiritimatiellia bacterium]|jgi:Fe-S-cluster-containing dehydrogenase component
MIATKEQFGKIESVEDLLGRAFREQQTLTAVERYAQKHEAGTIPAQARYYADLMPATPPRPGEQYAFEVDLDRCTSCKACVTACHNLNGLEPGETWRSTGLLIGGEAERSFQQTVTTACHHCAEPACLKGCPVQAYEKDAVTGIVRHLDDQCIGCKYCQLTCPYDVPKYSKSKGIVRKCDMCSSRLSAGEAPACVQACPNQAIRIRTVSLEHIEGRSATHAVVPGAPSSRWTQPTTTYKTSRPLPENAKPADEHVKEPAHIPLVIMLVLSQLSVGMCLFGVNVLAATVVGALSMAAAMFHLGRPQYAFRALLGLKTSWLSREILAFGVYMASMAATMLWPPLAALALAAGLTGVFASVMVYGVTGRPSWTIGKTALRFFGATVILGAAAAYSPLGLAAALVGVFAERYFFFTNGARPKMPGGPGR